MTPKDKHPKEDEMSEPIGVGSWIECIRTDVWGDVSVVAGVPYFVVEIVPADDVNPCTLCGDDGAGLKLSGLEHAHTTWCLCCFRPLGGDPQSITLERLMDTPADPEQVMA